MANTIKCPHCNKIIEISEALKHQVESQIKTAISEEYEKKIEKVKQEAEEKAVKKFQEEKIIELADLKKQVGEKEEKLGEYRSQELKLREEKRKLEDERKDIVVKAKRIIDKERKYIQEKSLREAEEKHHHLHMEDEKRIKDLKKAVEEAQRTAQIGSQQLRGEVLELDLEKLLADNFPSDAIQPVGKGIKGADVRQIVKSSSGRAWGTILWESKRTKNWTNGWISKLKSDQRKEGADIAAIVTTAFPKELNTSIGQQSKVWICNPKMIIPLAMLLRKAILDAGYQKAVSEHRGKKADLIYDYITSVEFIQQVETLAEVFAEMQEQVGKERISFEKIWKQREGQIKRLFTSTVNIYGNVQGLAGSSAIPQIRGLELPEIESGE